MWGAPYEPGYHVLDGVRAALNSERLGPVPVGAGRPVGLLRRRPGQRMGRRDVRRLRARTQHRRRGARLTGRRPRPHLPPAQRQLPVRPARAWWSPRWRTSTPTWTGSSRSTPPTRASAMLRRLEKMTTVGRRHPDGRQGHGRLPRRAARADPDDARRSSTSSTSIKLGAAVPDPAGTDRAGGARLV